MTPREIFAAWAPSSSPWSAWAKPSLFSSLPSVMSTLGKGELLAVEEAPWLPVFDRHTAIVLDLPGEVVVTRGLQLARQGYRPVPLFNTTYESGAVVNVRPVLGGLNLGGEILSNLVLPPDAPPVFLLDSNRMPASGGGAPGSYDNRWLVLPQDFPSAAKLREHGLSIALLWQQERTQPAEDLAHVLRRWQEGGLSIYLESGTLATAPEPLTVSQPARYRSLFHRFFVLLGLRRNSAGGFGGRVPEPSQSSGFG